MHVFDQQKIVNELTTQLSIFLCFSFLIKGAEKLLFNLWRNYFVLLQAYINESLLMKDGKDKGCQYSCSLRRPPHTWTSDLTLERWTWVSHLCFELQVLMKFWHSFCTYVSARESVCLILMGKVERMGADKPALFLSRWLHDRSWELTKTSVWDAGQKIARVR